MRLSFEAWMRFVDEELEFRSYMSSAELPDCDYAAWWEKGVTPIAASKRALKEAATY